MKTPDLQKIERLALAALAKGVQPPRRYEGFEPDVRAALETHLAAALRRAKAVVREESTISGRTVLKVEAALTHHPSDEKLVRVLERVLQTTALLAAREGVSTVRSARLAKAATYEQALEQVNNESVSWAQAHSAELVTAINDTTRKQIRAAVTTAVDGGFGAKELADGLETNLAFSPQRSMLIARTEIAYANVSGNLISYRATGVQEKQWITAQSDVCDDCQMMDGEVVAIDDDFVMPTGDEVDGPPAHPNCRCDVVPVIDLKAPPMTGEDVEIISDDEPQVEFDFPPEPEPAPAPTPANEEPPPEVRSEAPAVTVLEPTPDLGPYDGTDLVRAAEELGPIDAGAAQNYHDAFADDWWEFRQDLPTDERRALDGYQKADYYAVNKYLRGGEVLSPRLNEEAIVARVAALSDVIAKAPPLSDDTLNVWRGARAKWAANLKVGDIVEDAGFTSTGLDFSQAIDFAKMSGDGLSGAVFRISLPTGAPGVYLTLQLNKAPWEYEVLLQRGSRFRVDRIVKNGEWWAVDLTWVGTSAPGVAKADDDAQEAIWKAGAAAYWGLDEWAEFMKVHPANYVPRDERGRFITIGMAREAQSPKEHDNAEKFHRVKAQWLREVKHDEAGAKLHDIAADAHKAASDAIRNGEETTQSGKAGEKAREASAALDTKPKRIRKPKAPKEPKAAEPSAPAGEIPAPPKFKTPLESTDWVKANLGVEMIVEDHPHAMQATQGTVELLAEARRRGAVMPEGGLIVVNGMFKGTKIPASTGGLVDVPMKANKTAPKIERIAVNAASNYWPTGHYPGAPPDFGAGSGDRYIVAHELGHVQQFHKLGEEEFWGRNTWMFGLTPHAYKDEVIARKVSVYATTSRVEFVAEVWAGDFLGKKYDDDVYELYKAYRGGKLLGAGKDFFAKKKTQAAA